MPLSWVDLYSVFLCLPGRADGKLRIWQKRLGSWARWWKTRIKVNPSQVCEQMGHPVNCHLPSACQTRPAPMDPLLADHPAGLISSDRPVASRPEGAAAAAAWGWPQWPTSGPASARRTSCRRRRRRRRRGLCCRARRRGRGDRPRRRTASASRCPPRQPED